MDNYRIEFSNKSKTPFEVGYRTFNSQTTLTLPGRNSVEYGKEVNTCFYHLLESFCNDLPPVNPVEGQTWYDVDAGSLKVYTDPQWVVVGRASAPKLPDDAVNPTLVDITVSKYLKLTGGDMTGPILLKSTSIDDPDNAAVTKSYVDNLQPAIVKGLVSLDGNNEPPTGPIITDLPRITSPLHAVTKKYADDNVPHITKQLDVALTFANNTSIGKRNTVILKPDNTINVFGNVDIAATVPFLDIPLGYEGTITSPVVLVNKTGTFSATVDVDAKLITKSSVEYLRIIKHGVLTGLVSVYFTVSGTLL